MRPALPTLAALALAFAPPAGADAPQTPPSPRPILTWPAGLLEVRVAYDLPIRPADAAAAVGSTAEASLPEPGAPARQVRLAVAGATVEDDGRTLVLAVDPHPRAATYTLGLPGSLGGPREYDLSGVAAEWTPLDAEAPAWSGWWPALDPGEARKVTVGSAEHDRGFALLARPGRLVLRAVPAKLPEGAVTLALKAGVPFEATFGFDTIASEPDPAGVHAATFELESTGDLLDLEVAVETGGAAPWNLAATLRGPGDPAGGRPLGGDDLLVPWTPPDPPAAGAGGEAPGFDLAGGDPARGAAVFKSEQAKCATCHAINGQGGAVGPALDDLAGRDPTWIFRQIAEPSASIHPGYASFTVALRDGRIALGTVRADGPDAIKVVDTNAQATVFPKAEIEEIRPSPTSVMPVGLAAAVGDAATRDLVAFLAAPAPR